MKLDASTAQQTQKDKISTACGPKISTRQASTTLMLCAYKLFFGGIAYLILISMIDPDVSKHDATMASLPT